MKQRISWCTWFGLMFKEFMVETATKSDCEVAELIECEKTGFLMAVIKLSERHTKDRYISDIIIDNEFLESLDKKTIRALTYLATVEQLQPDYSIVIQQMPSEVEDFILEIKSRRSCKTYKKTSSELSKDKDLIAKLSPIEANRVGYMAGVFETVKEYQIIRDKSREVL